MKNSMICIIMLIMLPSGAFAQSFKSVTQATNLGNLLASEKECGLSYNQKAISRWIDDNVAADDMSFSSTLSMMIQGSKFQISSLSPSGRTAHCRSVERAARYYRFME